MLTLLGSRYIGWQDRYRQDNSEKLVILYNNDKVAVHERICSGANEAFKAPGLRPSVVR